MLRWPRDCDSLDSAGEYPLDEGPCISNNGVEILYHCGTILETLRKQHSRIIDAQWKETIQQVLTWIDTKDKNLICSRLLLRAKTILWEKPADPKVKPLDFLWEDANYWNICGIILGELEGREEKTHVRIDSGKILEEIQSRFIENTPNYWLVRRYVLKCLAEYAEHCTKTIDTSGGKNYTAFWNTYRHCLSHIEAALDCLSKDPVLPTPGDIINTADQFADTWWQIIQSLSRESKKRNPEHPQFDDTIQRELPVLARRILPVVKGTTGFTAEAMRRWQEGVLQMTEQLNKDDKDIKDLLGHITVDINSITEYLKETEGVNGKEYNAIKDVREKMIPKLQNRDYRETRKKARLNCIISFAEEGGGTVEREGVIFNICPLSNRGLAIEVKGMTVDRVWEKELGLIKEKTIGKEKYSCRAIEAHLVDHSPEGERKTISIKNLTVAFDADGLHYSNTFHISRAWPIDHPDGKCGLALLAEEKDFASNPDWEKFIKKLPIAT